MLSAQRNEQKADPPRRAIIYSLITGLLLILTAGCRNGGEMLDNTPFESVPEHFPKLPHPETNQPSKDRFILGKRLFYDPVLSVDSTVSCASCHQQQFAFADTTKRGKGIHGRTGMRNVPSLANVAYHPALNADGGVPTLEIQPLVPIEDENEMDFHILHVAERLNQSPDYVKLAKSAYGRPPDPFVITRSLALFCRSVISGRSRYDLHLNAPQQATLTPAERNGLKLFQSARTGCATCHQGVFLSNFSFENIGLYKTYTDPGRMRITLKEKDAGKFKTPSLRNVAITPPYMHDGSLKTLEAVIDHYDRGGVAHPNKHPAIRPLNLTAQEKKDLVEFLGTLTDTTLLRDPHYAPAGFTY